MAGFGSLGGLGGRPGGFGASYPSRGGNAPVSGQVMSDQEFHNDWSNRLAAVPQTVSNSMNLVPGASSYDAGMASPFINQIDDQNKAFTQRSFGVAPGQDKSLDKATDYAQSLGFTFQRNADGTTSLQRSAYGPASTAGATGGSHTVRLADTPNPEWGQLNQQYQTEAGRREDAQTRNQQAYDWMLGGNQINGIIGPEYTNPYFNQIGAQAGQIPEGTNMDWAADVYRPGDTYTAPRANSKGWNFW
jgi:hypothetical protein